MTIVLFLVDTSASMLQKIQTHTGRMTLIDIAKRAIETFITIRQYKSDSNGDRYMLLTFEEHPHNIKAGWKENLTTFMNELKNLQCSFRTVMGLGLRQAFDLLNLNRMQSGIDTYGLGRNPYYVESALIIIITDGGLYNTATGITEELSIPLASQVPGADLTKEPFRWDQRVYALVLRLPGTVTTKSQTNSEVEYVPRDQTQIEKMCEVTGGRSYCIRSQQMLLQCIESLVNKVQDGIVVKFEHTDTGSGEEYKSWQSVRNVIYVPRSSSKKHLGYWPIPEPYWPDITLTALPPRNAQPTLVYRCVNKEPMFHKSIPWDKYKLEPSPLTQYILSRKQKDICWQVYAPNSGKYLDTCHPFGYLKVNSKLTCVYLIILPYNFPVLIPLIEELLIEHKPNHNWLKKLHGYLMSIPMYYHSLLKTVLTNTGMNPSTMQTLLPKFITPQLNSNLQNHLQNIRSRAKLEHEVLCDQMSSRTDIITKITHNPVPKFRYTSIPLARVYQPKNDYVTHPMMTKINYLDPTFQNHQIQVEIEPEPEHTLNLKNSFHVNKRTLLKLLSKMQWNYYKNKRKMIPSGEDKHYLPITEMGNYLDYMHKIIPQMLREIVPSDIRTRHNLFGNPFKPSSTFMIDEAEGGGDTSISYTSSDDLERNGGGKLEGKFPRKRRQGPVPKNYTFQDLKRKIQDSAENSTACKYRKTDSDQMPTVCNIIM